MGKTGKWIKNFLTGKKGTKEKVGRNNPTLTSGAGNQVPSTPPVSAATPKDKKRWSFRRSSATAPPPAGQQQNRDLNASENAISATTPNAKRETVESDHDQKMHALAAAAATAAAAAKAAVAVLQLTSVSSGRSYALEVAAAIIIQSVFRGYLARKALNALKGLVKLQALIRGHLVRKQAAATLRCMQALITAQARARAQRLKMAEDQENQRISLHRRSTQDNNKFHPSPYQELDRGMLDDTIKIVEMDLGATPRANRDHILSTLNGPYPKHEAQHNISPAPSGMMDQSPRVYSGHYEDYSYCTPQSSPHCHSKPTTPILYGSDSLYHEYPFYPGYMANTESSRAKVRSHSAPKTRPETFERQPSKRRPSIEGKNLPRAIRMQRSTSHVGSTPQSYHYPWSIKLDRSNMSLKDSECGSTCSVLTTNTMYSRHVVGFDVQGNRY
ncbi:unnamed protein product [Cuscuta epithymum]|uniref:DUF4005 domain-containing protein n=1 Tax=Cuscuta epithymum TaxID=186058 RepID=A0AAV0GBL4_9ASTE|nr:unnamed protein product [Cuscuta epithymum]